MLVLTLALFTSPLFLLPFFFAFAFAWFYQCFISLALAPFCVSSLLLAPFCVPALFLAPFRVSTLFLAPFHVPALFLRRFTRRFVSCTVLRAVLFSCIISRAASRIVLRVLRRSLLHVACIAWFYRRFAFPLAFAYRVVMLTAWSSHELGFARFGAQIALLST